MNCRTMLRATNLATVALAATRTNSAKVLAGINIELGGLTGFRDPMLSVCWQNARRLLRCWAYTIGRVVPTIYWRAVSINHFFNAESCDNAVMAA